MDYIYITQVLISFIIFYKIKKCNINRLLKFNIDEKECKKHTSYFLSFIHALITSLLSIIVIIDLSKEIYKTESYHYLFNILSSISVGYFVNDLMYLFSLKFNKSTLLYVLHHVVFSNVLGYFGIKGIFHGPLAVFTLGEITTVVNDIYYYYKFWTKYYHNTNNEVKAIFYDKLSHYIFICFSFTFYTFRILIYAIFIFFVYPLIIDYDPKLLSVVFFTIILNLIWFVGICKVLNNYRSTLNVKSDTSFS